MSIVALWATYFLNGFLTVFPIFINVYETKFNLVIKKVLVNPGSFFINKFVELESLKLRAKFQYNLTPGSEGEDIKIVSLYLAVAAIWSCDLNHLYKLSFPLPVEILHDIWL